MTIAIRWLIRKDLAQVLAIEQSCFEFPWSEKDFLAALRPRNCIGMVAEVEHQVVGYMIYELQPQLVRLLDFAVHEDCRYHGIGTALVQKLTHKLSTDRRRSLVLDIRETNLDAQLFFKRLGFQCINTVHGFYQETDEDAYTFEYSLAKAKRQKAASCS